MNNNNHNNNNDKNNHTHHYHHNNKRANSLPWPCPSPAPHGSNAPLARFPPPPLIVVLAPSISPHQDSSPDLAIARILSLQRSGVSSAAVVVVGPAVWPCEHGQWYPLCHEPIQQFPRASRSRWEGERTETTAGPLGRIP